MASSACATDEAIVLYVEDRLTAPARATIERHLDECAGCRVVASDLAAATLPGRGAARGIDAVARRHPGDQVGRYLILHELGAGGMGRVYAAYDPELDRKVALKLLHGGADEAARAQLLREARALARLAHPHVLAIHDAGLAGDEVFLALAYVAGSNLRTWLADAPRAWPAVRDVFVAVGRGLAAVHAAGLVHRDIKPENILLGVDGRILVSDLGIALAATADNDAARGPSSRAVAGTVPYMAPEQRRGERVDARSDQFSYCVALYEAVTGARPFADEAGPALAEGVARGAAPLPLTSRGVPARARDAILRGLRADPTERHPSMTALLATLDPSRRVARRWGVAGLAVVSVGLLATAALTRHQPDRCGGAPQRLAGIWDPAVRGAVERGFHATDRPWADEVFARAARGLDGYAADWSAMHRGACEATHVDGEQSSTLLDLRMACLDRRLAALGALTAVLASDADGATVDGAVQAIASLTPLTACADAAALTALVPPPDDPAQRAAVDALAARLDRAEALQRIGRYDQALALTTPLVDEALATEHAAIIAHALYVHGDLLFRSGDSAGAEDRLHQAASAAARAHDDARAAQIGVLLVALVGYIRGEIERGLTLARVADAQVLRAGDGDDLRAELEDNLGLVDDAAGRYDAARTHYQRGLDLRARVHGERSLEVSLSLNNLAAVPYEQGNYDEAADLWQRALELRRELLGPGGPEVAATTSNLASARRAQGRTAEARALSEQALAIWEASLGADHPDVAVAHNNLGDLLRSTGDLAAAVAHLERAHAIWVARLGADHPSAISAAGNLGLVRFARGDLTGALADLEDALVRGRRVRGAEHPEDARTLVNLGAVLKDLHRLDDALARYREAAAILDRDAPPAPGLATALDGVGAVLIALGRLREAIAPLERALVLPEQVAIPGARAAIQFRLATALWPTPATRRRAIELATEAHAAFAAAGDPDAVRVAAWLGERGHAPASPPP